MGRRRLRLIAAAAMSLAAAAVARAADGDWIPAHAVAPIVDSASTAELRAQRDALARALAVYLQTWLSVREIESQADLLNRWFFTQPQMYVESTTDVTAKPTGNRFVWDGYVRFDAARVSARLHEVGLISPGERDPTFALVPLSGGVDTLAPLTATTWFQAMQNAGFHLTITATAPVSGANVDGTWYVQWQTSAVADPFRGAATWAVTDAVIAGEIRGAPIRFEFAVAPADLVAPADVVDVRAVDDVISLWAPAQLHTIQDAMWTLGDLEFVSTADWLQFEHKLDGQRAVFHQIHPIFVGRRTGHLVVRYGFFLNPGEDDVALAWLHSQGIAVHREGVRRFVAD